MHIGGVKRIISESFFGYLCRLAGKGDKPRSFNTPVAMPIAETARIAFTLAGKHTELGRSTMEIFEKLGHIQTQKAHHVLGCQPQTDLDEGMRRTETRLRE